MGSQVFRCCHGNHAAVSSSGPSGNVSRPSVWSCWLRPGGYSCLRTTCILLPPPHWTCTCTEAKTPITDTWSHPCCPVSSPTPKHTPCDSSSLGGRRGAVSVGTQQFDEAKTFFTARRRSTPGPPRTSRVAGPVCADHVPEFSINMQTNKLVSSTCHVF